MIDRNRLEVEKEILEERLGNDMFKFINIESEEPILALAVVTNSGNLYTLVVELDDFPDARPDVYVAKMLKDAFGNNMEDPSHCMHTLSSKNEWTQICHYSAANWEANISLLLVYVRCAMWLNAYEAHLQDPSHKPIDHWLGS